MTKDHSTTYAGLERQLRHSFSDQDLLIRALTHSSALHGASNKDNERLEFLGDRVLSLLAAEALLRSFPRLDEGGLAIRLNALVRRETCAEVAVEVGLGNFLILADSEEKAGGRQKTAIIADACEALIGALYLDGGFDACREFFSAKWGDRIAGLDEAPRDAKTALQEWAQSIGLPTPDYQLVNRDGPDHAPKFCVEVRVRDRISCRGSGPSKKIAEHIAAGLMLVQEGIWDSAGE